MIVLAVALAVGLRIGVLPFHLRIPQLTDVAPPIALPLLLAWVPLPLAVVGLAAVDLLVAPLALPLGGEQVIIVAVVIVTLGGASLAAFLQDDIRHMTGYIVIADGAIVLLGLAALDPRRVGPGADLAGGAGGDEDRPRDVGGGRGVPLRDAPPAGHPGLDPTLAAPRRGAARRHGRELRVPGLGGVRGADHAGAAERRGPAGHDPDRPRLPDPAGLPAAARRSAPAGPPAASIAPPPERIMRTRRVETLPVEAEGRRVRRGARPRPCSRDADANAARRAARRSRRMASRRRDEHRPPPDAGESGATRPS